MRPIEELLADAYPGERVLARYEVSFEVSGGGRLGKVPVSGGRVRSLGPVVLVETQRFVLLDQRPGVARNIRRAVRVALPVLVVSGLTWLLPVADRVHLVLLVPAFLAAWVLATAIGGVQTNSGTTGLSNVIVIDKSLADSDVVQVDGTRVLSGETRRDHAYAASLSVHLEDAGTMPGGLLGSSSDPLMSAPLFRWLRRRAPGRVLRTYRIRRVAGSSAAGDRGGAGDAGPPAR